MVICILNVNLLYVDEDSQERKQKYRELLERYKSSKKEKRQQSISKRPRETFGSERSKKKNIELQVRGVVL